MTDKKPAQNPDFAPALAALIERHQLTEARAAGLLGVPVFTLRKWRTGQRAPSAAAVRLVEVLDMVGALAPALLAGLIPAPVPPKPPKLKPKMEKSPL
jgi:DNA-binding transcriptional regulator YiaG